MKNCGIDLLLYVESPSIPGTYLLVGAMQANTFTVNKETVDVTDKGGAGWRELLDCGIKTATIAGNGVFEDDAQLMQIFLALFNGPTAILNFRIIFGKGTVPEQIQGAYAIASFERTGEYNTAETFSLSLESAGAQVYTPATP